MKDKHISLGAALYTINKYAKSIRDARQILKHILFDQVYTEPLETPDALMDFFQNTSLCYEDLYVYNIDGMPDKLHEIENELFYRIESDLIEIGEEHEEINEWMINHKFTTYDLISFCIGDFQLSEDIPNILLDYAKDIEYDIMFIRDLNKNIQLAHKYLHDSLIIKDFLYDLKEAVILTLNIPVIGYHEFKNDKNNIYLLFNIDGFLFHIPVDPDLIDLDLDEFESKKLDTIKSDNLLSEEKKLSIEESVKYLLNILNIDDNQLSTFLTISEAGIEYDNKFEELLDIDFFEKSYHYSKYEDYDKYGYYDECGYYDEYEDYDECGYYDEYGY